MICIISEISSIFQECNLNVRILTLAALTGDVLRIDDLTLTVDPRVVLRRIFCK